MISTVDQHNTPHNSVVVYQSDGEDLYIQTGANTLKARNIMQNNKRTLQVGLNYEKK
ncbi:MAG: hypothetical protein GF311_07840 [Candidatus Lokiarchaeota archaeon]|nr:hypothetical protein [Candidatus Lokiarchaeota archaeon]